MGNIIVGAIVVLLIGLAVFGIYRSKKRGEKCVGCSGCSAGKPEKDGQCPSER